MLQFVRKAMQIDFPLLSSLLRKIFSDTEAPKMKATT